MFFIDQFISGFSWNNKAMESKTIKANEIRTFFYMKNSTHIGTSFILYDKIGSLQSEQMEKIEEFPPARKIK